MVPSELTKEKTCENHTEDGVCVRLYLLCAVCEKVLRVRVVPLAHAVCSHAPFFLLECAEELRIFVLRRRNVQETLQNGHPGISQH